MFLFCWSIKWSGTVNQDVTISSESLHRNYYITNSDSCSTFIGHVSLPYITQQHVHWAEYSSEKQYKCEHTTTRDIYDKFQTDNSAPQTVTHLRTYSNTATSPSAALYVTTHEGSRWNDTELLLSAEKHTAQKAAWWQMSCDMLHAQTIFDQPTPVMMLQSSQTVSYTHLTLPTNREV